jgi:hypothetical protein
MEAADCSKVAENGSEMALMREFGLTFIKAKMESL